MRRLTMNKAKLFVQTAAVALLGLVASGCSNTVRLATPMYWTAAGGGSPIAAPVEQRILYVTYWEGSCSAGILGFGKGCSLGDSKIRRCNVKPDNTMTCVEEAEANQAFARNKK